MPATFTVDAYPREQFQGDDPADPQRAADACRTSSPTTRSSTSTTRSSSCKPGMTANVTFVYAERDGVLRVAERGAALPAAARSWRGRRRRRRGAAAAAQREKQAAAGGRGDRRGRRATARRRRGGETPRPADASGCCAAASREPVPVEIGVSDGTHDRGRRGRRCSEGDVLVTDAVGKRRSARRADAAGGRRAAAMRRHVLSDADARRSSQLDDVTKIYRMGDVEVHALRGVDAATSTRASSSPSWARRARASRR